MNVEELIRALERFPGYWPVAVHDPDEGGPLVVEVTQLVDRVDAPGDVGRGSAPVVVIR